MFWLIKHVVDNMRLTVACASGRDVTLEICEDISTLDFPEESLIFFIGDKSPAFERRLNCFYVYLNFELLYRLGKFRQYKLDKFRQYLPIAFKAIARCLPQQHRLGTWWIDHKYNAFKSKLKSFDMILDFYAPQTSVLREEFSQIPIEIMSFPVNVSLDPEPIPEISQRRWDVCFVGANSDRRKVLYEKLIKMGLSLSPMSDIDLSYAIANARVTLNVHYAPCNTFETPRIIQALKMGCCLVTEPCYGMSSVIPSDCYVESNFSGLAKTTQELLREPERIDCIARNAKDFMMQKYDPTCLLEWKLILERIDHLLQAKGWR
jgi:Glycosyl transferases group 1